MSALQNADKVRILVLGDSGVGKTSLIELVCSGEELRKPRSTVGCAVHMKIHESRATGKTCFVEFWDIGGSERFKESRRVFYGTAFDGVLLVYDLANSVSRRNLEKWRTEWQSAHFGGGAGAWGGGHHSSSAGAGAGVWAEDSQDLGYFSPAKRRSIDAQNAWGAGAGGAGGAPRGSGALPPILTVGNKQDLVAGKGVAGHGSTDDCEEVSVEGGQGGHEIAVTACRKGKNTTGCSVRDHETICQHMDSFFDRALHFKQQTAGGVAPSSLRQLNSSSSMHAYKRD